MSVLTAYATLIGSNRDQLSIRLSWLARDYLRHIVTKPGLPARLDACSVEALWVAEAVENAVRLLVAQDEKISRAALADAVRNAEARWQKVRVDLRRGRTTYVDWRFEHTYRPEIQLRPADAQIGPALAGGVPRLTLVRDRSTIESTRLDEARRAEQRKAETRPAETRRRAESLIVRQPGPHDDRTPGGGAPGGRTPGGRSRPGNRVAEKAVVSRVAHRGGELTQHR
jgi:hypothetical protein